MSRSITPAPSGSLSPDFITVPSSTGFSAGDYVYQKNGDFGLPPSPGVANFNISPASPIYGATVGGTATAVNYYTTGLTTISGGSSGQCAAKLSNGNIVIVYATAAGTGYPTFRIVDVDNVEVVAPVTILAGGSNLPAPYPIGVVALTGGGFVAYFIDAVSGTDPGFAIYTNTGTVTTAYAADGTFPTTATASLPITACALPNGGFALSVVGVGAVNAYLRSYSATGVGAYAWITAFPLSNTSNSIAIAARSDSSVCLVGLNNSSTIYFNVYNSSGGGITGIQAIAVTNAPLPYVTCLTNDTFVIGYRAVGNTLSYSFNLLPTGNVLSSQFTVPSTGMIPTPVGASTAITWLKELSSGGFVYFISGGAGALYYMVYTSAGVPVFAAPKPCPPILYNVSSFYRIGMAEIPGYLSLYHVGTFSGSSTQMYDIYNTKIDLTTYELLSTVTTTSPVGTASASASTYARSTSLPMKAAYLAANTETVALNQVMSTGTNYTVAPSAVYANTVSGVKSTTLPDGRFAIAYKDATSGAVGFNVYSVTGVLQTTVAVGTGATGAAARVRIAALSSGKIVVGYQTTGASSITLALYSSTFGLITTITQTTDASPRFDLAGIAGDRFVLVFTNTSANPDVSIFSNAGVLVVNYGQIASGITIGSYSVYAAPNGAFWVAYTAGTTIAAFASFYKSGANNYALFQGPTNYGGGSNQTIPSQLAVNSSGIVTLMSASAAATLELFTAANTHNATIQGTSVTTATTSNWGTAGLGAVGATGAGTFLFFGLGNATANLYGFSGVSSISAISSTPSGLLSGINGSTSNMQACITPSYGYNAVIAWINTSNIAQYAIVNAYPFGATQAITAGVTGSAPTTPLNISQSSGYYLAGVAVSDCPPGGTGQIQTNGVANLNSQYSTTTAFQGFDFQNPVTVGVKGTAVGRTVTMIKD